MVLSKWFQESIKKWNFSSGKHKKFERDSRYCRKKVRGHLERAYVGEDGGRSKAQRHTLFENSLQVIAAVLHLVVRGILVVVWHIISGWPSYVIIPNNFILVNWRICRSVFIERSFLRQKSRKDKTVEWRKNKYVMDPSIYYLIKTINHYTKEY